EPSPSQPVGTRLKCVGAGYSRGSAPSIIPRKIVGRFTRRGVLPATPDGGRTSNASMDLLLQGFDHLGVPFNRGGQHPDSTPLAVGEVEAALGRLAAVTIGPQREEVGMGIEGLTGI